jgi:hypothetical protein
MRGYVANPSGASERGAVFLRARHGSPPLFQTVESILSAAGCSAGATTESGISKQPYPVMCSLIFDGMVFIGNAQTGLQQQISRNHHGNP